ncbi:MAG: hypothetical protein HZR80_14735 [Candidatus Heimdallarchaeota archaeon]
MNRKNRLLLLIIVFTGLLTSSQVTFGGAFQVTANTSHVAFVVDNKYEGVTNHSAIALKVFSNNVTSSQIKLSFYGTPILNQSYGYRIVIAWSEMNNIIRSEMINIISIARWPDYFNWEKSVYPKSNFTQCYAGGVSGFGVVNGSYSEFYNSSGSLIFSEANNNSVILDGNSLIFPVNQTFVNKTPINGSTPLNPDHQFLAFATYNTTRTETFANGTTIISNVTLMDALPDYYISYMYHIITHDSRINIVIFIGLIGLVGASQVIYLKRRRK